MISHTVKNSPIDIKEFIADIFPFKDLSQTVLDNLVKKIQVYRYCMGQAILQKEAMPTQISIIYQGQARLLGFDSYTHEPITLKLLSAGEALGWVSHIRGVACETIIASTEVVCLNLPIADFIFLLKHDKDFALRLHSRAGLIEIYELLVKEFHHRADGETDLIVLTHKCIDKSVILSVHKKQILSKDLKPEFLWLVSNLYHPDLPIGTPIDAKFSVPKFNMFKHEKLRLLGLPKSLLQTSIPTKHTTINITNIPYASVSTQLEFNQQHHSKYPYTPAKNRQDAVFACFQMLSEYFHIPLRRDMLRQVMGKLAHTGGISLRFCGAVAELLGITTQMVNVPASAIPRLQMPVMISWQDSFAIIYQNHHEHLIIACPETGVIRRKIKDFAEVWGINGEVLLLQPNKHTAKSPFGLHWFVPALKRYRKVLIEVLIASMVVQIFGLVNPLATQVIIDKVIVGNSPDSLEVFGIFILVVSVAEAALTAIRTQLFVDTSNRIDISLGSEVINHLLRLPLSYFERRPVGELATRVGELENIRQFLTGTALTVVIDAVFSVVYILVMTIYSPVLTIVALATVPLFALLNLFVSPLMRRQLQAKAERNAETHSYLVEIMAGMQTVKAQNLETRSRYSWQERYTRYINAGFKTISTQTTASSISSFLNKFSTLLVLWVGAYLVLHQQLSLGELIAFRILSGYVTSPLLRLVQLWQNFQETALSLQRLSDILDTPQEIENDAQNILIPSILGSVRYNNLCFSFRQQDQLQLCNINLDIAAGTFVGIVGQSGSGKSTLLKLLPRLYKPQSGKILIDGYDISKVELYSLRRQIGVVLQDTLLFEGTVRENIALACPDAGDEEIIAAAKVAFAHDFIMNLPNGYNTQVGERGSALSGGQRQRIAIARTVLQNPQILILDEATSALDYNAEAQVCRNLAKAFQGKTVFFITHRLSTIRNADTILVMNSGAVVEQGTHEKLMSHQGYYYCLYKQQDSQI
ncbi:hypothetical protein DSM106972_014510 [Dulcicalothrix desertica PCC 7102]|uniref:Peptidase C39 n=1 Tax=Dulcicalothrix desertica PCC 7102 TaxID=232991 RepID=A0A3S1CIQ0_9CYAN|nr:peptidase domain-containing ABC transporter [Dulcicalothrix desertica]RUT08283.1 hypothetical protein DSM106972_014510 [Dulcicalothrix desertica PCC 7102]TWH40150.1 ATP-binding cassette subfamily B protein [Dulcicalothrix desertica PCC 7102]